MNNTTDFRFRWTLSAGEAEPPNAIRLPEKEWMVVTLVTPIHSKTSRLKL